MGDPLEGDLLHRDPGGDPGEVSPGHRVEIETGNPRQRDRVNDLHGTDTVLSRVSAVHGVAHHGALDTSVFSDESVSFLGVDGARSVVIAENTAKRELSPHDEPPGETCDQGVAFAEQKWCERLDESRQEAPSIGKRHSLTDTPL